MDSRWTLTFMDENNYVFHREPLDANVPVPQSPTWNFADNHASDVKQFLDIPGWKGKSNPTVYYTTISYKTREFVVALHGIWGDTRNG